MPKTGCRVDDRRSAEARIPSITLHSPMPHSFALGGAIGPPRSARWRCGAVAQLMQMGITGTASSSPTSVGGRWWRFRLGARKVAVPPGYDGAGRRDDSAEREGLHPGAVEVVAEYMVE